MINFGIIMPAYNAENYIAKSIISVLEQTYENWQLVIVDDGSTDNTSNIIDHYAAIDNRIKVFHIDNGGPLKARCYGMSKIVCDYYMFLDADDELFSNACAVVAGEIKKNNIDVVFFGQKRINNRGKEEWLTESKKLLCSDMHYVSKKRFLHDEYLTVLRHAVSYNLAHDVDLSKYYDVKMCEDQLQSLAMTINAKKVIFLSDVLYYQNLNLSSVTHTINRLLSPEVFIAREGMLDILKTTGKFDDSEIAMFKGKCVRTIFGDLFRMSKNRTSYSKRVCLCKTIRKTFFYKQYLIGSNIDVYNSLGLFGSVAWFLFKKDVLLPLFVATDLFRFLNR